ncbi:Spherulation-specific family 4-domain-containing protein [Favolaschia claudopus]|uniref:Spherulation-specific family 4-domain-containing protein n=1 Tax=Favolaschia claudopus TaxID=2862362 RepID=A0AAW0BRP8_9AGAR
MSAGATESSLSRMEDPPDIVLCGQFSLQVKGRHSLPFLSQTAMLAHYIPSIWLFVVPCTYALGILLPLYIYPDSSCVSWSSAFEAISVNSNTRWYIIVNPDNGPGALDQLYQDCVSQIPVSSDQVIMGYVDTAAGNVLGDVDTYAGWPSSSRPRGIFFDSITPTTNQLSTYQSYISHAKSKGFTFTGLDSGESVSDSAYFSIADLINTYEDSYASFNPDSLTGTILKQSVILVNSPTTGSYRSVISQLKMKGVAAVYISTVSDSTPDLPAQLSLFASEVSSTSSNSDSSNNLNGSTTDASSRFIAIASSSSTPTTGTPNSPPSSQSSSSKRSPSQSPGINSIPGLSTTSASSPTASNSENVPDPNQTQTPSSSRQSIAPIIGGVIGGLVLLTGLLIAFLCVRRRRRDQLASPDTVPAPFTEVNNPSRPMIGIGSTAIPTRGGNGKLEPSLVPPASSEANPCTHRPSNQTTEQWDTLSKTSGPPPSYHI